MNLIHISDIHFGPYHWAADDNILLERLNAVGADVVLNTGDMTSDSLEDEFRQAQQFLSKLTCNNVISINGNHDKFSRRSQEMFREFIYDTEFVQPTDPAKVVKNKVFIDPASAKLNTYFTELNYTHLIEVNGEKVLFVCVDTNMFQRHEGYVEVQILDALGKEIARQPHDRALMLAHHSVLGTDEHPLINSQRLTDFIYEHRIEATFCGHTHELDLSCVTDLVQGRSFRQFMGGTLSSVNASRDKNMFCTYENFGTPDEIITVTRMTLTDSSLEFEEMVVGGKPVTDK